MKWRNRVDFPAPLAPRRTVLEPSAMRTVTLSRATFRPW